MDQTNMSVCELSESQSQNDLTPPQYVFARTKGVTLEDFQRFKEEVKSIIQTLKSEQLEKDKDILPTVLDIKKSNTNIENSISLLIAQNQELTSKITQLETKSKEDREYIAILEDRVEQLQMGARKTNLEIKNVPKKTNESKEDLIDMVMCLSTSIGGNLRKDDIKDIYRLRGKKAPQNPTIVLETTSSIKKTETLKLCRAFNVKTKTKICAKHLGFRTSEDTPVFVSEQLTPRGSRLHFLARDLAKSQQYKYCWTAYGKVYIRKTDNSPIISVTSEAQIQQLLVA